MVYKSLWSMIPHRNLWSPRVRNCLIGEFFVMLITFISQLLSPISLGIP